MGQVVFTRALGNIPTGTYTLAAVSVPSWASGVVINTARCTTPTPTIWPSAAQKIIASFDLSFDGGATWYDGLFQFTISGGIVADSTGHEVDVGVETFNHTPTPTHIRGTIQVVDGPINTSVQVTVN